MKSTSRSPSVERPSHLRDSRGKVRSHCVALTKQRRAGLRLTPPQRLLVRYVMASECDVDWWWVTIYVLTSSDRALPFPVVTSRGSHWSKSVAWVGGQSSLTNNLCCPVLVWCLILLSVHQLMLVTSCDVDSVLHCVSTKQWCRLQSR